MRFQGVSKLLDRCGLSEFRDVPQHLAIIQYRKDPNIMLVNF
jgi:hypothetical protein